MDPVVINVEAGDVYWWCRCGRSRRPPFCDGSHKGGDHSPLKHKAAGSGPLRFCTCRETASPPVCDGRGACSAAPDGV